MDLYPSLSPQCPTFMLGEATFTAKDFEAAEERVKAAITENKFGVMWRLDIAETLKKKLGVSLL